MQYAQCIKSVYCEHAYCVNELCAIFVQKQVMQYI